MSGFRPGESSIGDQINCLGLTGGDDGETSAPITGDGRDFAAYDGCKVFCIRILPCRLNGIEEIANPDPPLRVFLQKLSE